jgi:hypothetical protein
LANPRERQADRAIQLTTSTRNSGRSTCHVGGTTGAGAAERETLRSAKSGSLGANVMGSASGNRPFARADGAAADASASTEMAAASRTTDA